MSVVLISHDLGVIAEFARRVLVMYAGRMAEQAPVRELFARPLHPYTQGLIGAVPRLARDGGAGERLVEIRGIVPSPAAMPPGCRFAPRCRLASAQCRSAVPAWREAAPAHPRRDSAHRAPMAAAPLPRDPSVTPRNPPARVPRLAFIARDFAPRWRPAPVPFCKRDPAGGETRALFVANS